MIYFIGPTADTGGPAIKNKILCDYLRGKHIRFKQCNTYSQSWKNRITCLLKILFTNADTFLVAVGRKGNRMIYPLLYWKKKIRPSVRYALVCIGCLLYTSGRVVERGSFSAINHLWQGEV